MCAIWIIWCFAKLNFHLQNNLLLFMFMVLKNVFTSDIKTATTAITIVNNARKFGNHLKRKKILGYVILSISKVLNFTFVCDVRRYWCIPVMIT